MTEEHPFERGPYLAAAVLCERVLTEQDGVNSLIRVVDRVTHTVTGQKPPRELEPFDYRLFLYLSLKSGTARGGKEIAIRIQKPSGESPQAQTFHVNFEGEDDRGINLVVELRLQIDVAGVWWFDVTLDGARLTRLPLRVIYMRQTMPPVPPGRLG